MGVDTALEGFVAAEVWALRTIGETGKYINGLAFKPTDWGDEGMPIIRIQNLTNPTKPLNRTKREVDPIYVVKPGDILVSWSATLDVFIWDREPSLLNQHIFKVVPDTSVVTRKFLFYALKKAIAEMIKSEHLHGSTMKHINRGPFLAHKVEIPSLVEQGEIVAELEKQFSRLDEAVANLQRVKANLKRYKASVLKDAVEGRLVPTEAELARREGRTFETGEQLLQRILEARRKEWTGKGKFGESIGSGNSSADLPAGWTWTTLGQCFRVAVGATPSRKEPSYWGGDIPWVSSGEVQLGRIRNTDEHISAAGLANSSTQLNPAGSVMIGMIGQGRTRGQAAILDIEAANNQNCAAIWVSRTEIPTEYVFFWLMSRYTETRSEGSGNNQQALNKRLVEQIPLPLPPLAEQRRIVAEVDRRLSLVHGVEAEVETNLKRAQALRQSVLQQSYKEPAIHEVAHD